MENVRPNALVTGASGVLGRIIAGILEQDGYRVLRHDGRQQGDLATREGARAAVVSDLDLIVNAAGLSYGAPEELWQANTMLPVRLAEALDEAGSDARLILLGSAAVYGLAFDRQTKFSEDAVPAPNSEYGMAKLAAERLVGGLYERTVSARVFNIASAAEQEGERTLLARVRTAVAAGEAPPPGIDDVRDWVTPEFIGQAIAAIAAAPAPASVINVCTGEGRSPAELLGLPQGEPRSWSIGDPSRLQALMTSVACASSRSAQ